MQVFDLIVLGAGAAGLFCAAVAGQRGARVVVLDHSERLAEKIRISGGGRCNFTNREADRPERYLSEQESFMRSALKAYPPRRFIDLVRAHGIGFHEKHRGQLFCDRSSDDIIQMLMAECGRGGVQVLRPVQVGDIRHDDSANRYEVGTTQGVFRAPRLAVATGGLSIPKIGATDLAYRIARQFGLAVVQPRPGLVPLTFGAQVWSPMVDLAGLSLEVDISVARDLEPHTSMPAQTGRQHRTAINGARFREDLLFTHRGLSGPAILQISNYWREGARLNIDLAPGIDLEQPLLEAKKTSRQNLGPALTATLAEQVPRRLIAHWLMLSEFAADTQKRIAEVPNKRLISLAQSLRQWVIQPEGSEGYRKAEVTLGGLDTRELDARTMQTHKHPGLYFVGEAVDVTGWLGGYNFQWAWASGYAAALSASAT